MSKLDDLIKNLCPNGVESKPIKNFFTRLRGTSITASKMKEISNPLGDIRIFAGGKTVINAFKNDIPNSNIIDVPAVLVQSRGIIDFIFYEKPFTFKNEMWAYTNDEKISVKFLYYVLKNNVKYFREAASGMGSMPQISLSVTEDFKIPLPPLEVQREIVRILDNFTELTAELTARKKQYEYYRDLLLTFDGVEFKTLGEVFNMRNGYTPSTKNPNFWEGGTISWFRMDDIRINGRILKDSLKKITPLGVKGKLFEKKSIILATTATIGEHALLLSESLANQQFTNFSIREEFKSKLSPKFVFYYFFVIDNWCKENTRVSSFPSVDMDKLKKIKIPVPPIEKQERIVKILDRFDKLCNDISDGLPAEIAACQKQYEYYRDKLLMFDTQQNGRIGDNAIR